MKIKKQIVTLVLPVFVIASIQLIPSKTWAAEIKRKFPRSVVVAVLDGDSLLINLQGKVRNVRLWGIDAPEKDQMFSSDATALLKRLVWRKRVDVEPVYYDKYGRTVARVFIHNEELSRLLVENGYAWVHRYYCDEEICTTWKRLEQQARIAKSGLWIQDSPQSPWEWKRRKVNRR